ncbi:MAG: hypothetical protein ACNYPH_05855 [Gammaproteobacteria bacterium WSBS_2016_MAG_OTU1]
MKERVLKMQDYRDVLLFRINKSYKKGLTARGLYEATCGTWRISVSNANSIKYAVAIVDGAIRQVYEVKSWRIAGTIIYKTRPYLDKVDPTRKEFIGNIAKGDVRKLIGRKIDYWGRNPFCYGNLNELMKK